MAAEEKDPGRVSAVTLYRGQAKVTRTLSIKGPAGNRVIVVENLPGQIIPGSLFAEGGEQLEVHAVRFRTRAVGVEPLEEIRNLNKQIAELEEKQAANTANQQLLHKHAAYLDKLEGFVAPTATIELSKGVLNTESLQKMTLFILGERQKVTTKELSLNKERKQLAAEESKLQRQRSELASGSTKTTREAVVFLNKTANNDVNLQLNYLVSECGWSASYTIRAGKDRKEVQIEYNAMIHQLSGEDWTDVKLDLSTASLALGSSSPGLAPFYVTLNQGQAQATTPNMQVDTQTRIQSIRKKQTAAIEEQRNSRNVKDNISSSWIANNAADEVQGLELLGGQDVLAELRANDGASEETSHSYKLNGVVSLESRTDRQMVRILKSSMKSKFYHVASPILTTNVYREAELANASENDLMAGPVTVYLEGEFVGSTEIPTVARGQTFVVGFGADTQLRARREIAKKSQDIQGGNRELELTYRLVIENFKDEDVDVRLFERVPHAERTAEIRVTLQTIGKETLSGDKVYLRREKPKGILRWDITVPKLSSAEKARIVEYGFKLEFDRNFQIGARSNGTADPAQLEFEEFFRSRLTH